MSLPWLQRKTRLVALLKSGGDEDEEGLALDRILHGQSVIGKTTKTTEIDSIRFQDKDLVSAGTLAYGQFGVIDAVTCRINGRVYVRKSIEKRFALRARDQCFPQFERDLLLQAAKTDSQWVPHLLCAFQTPTHLNLVMDYAEGGTLWDVLESSPHDGKVTEEDLMWWTPQIVSAINWCHLQGFTHRDIKPHNFVLSPEAYVLLIDFGSAAPLLPPGPDGSQCLPKKYCLVPCGTCDYISPEILKAHEEALIALEMEDSNGDLQDPRVEVDTTGYGRETDWWSLGAMLYEMAYGSAPFFANDIRQTYLRIVDHQKRLRFEHTSWISSVYQDFLRRLLTHADRRLGRRNFDEITSHPVFEGVNWRTLPTQTAPSNIHLPQFTYAEPRQLTTSLSHNGESHSQGFAFSAFFESSEASSSSPGLSILRSRSSPHPSRSPEDDSTASFIGFSWGPALDAFPTDTPEIPPETHPGTSAIRVNLDTPLLTYAPASHCLSPNTFPASEFALLSTPRPYPYSTPIRPGAVSSTPFQTLTRTSTARRMSVRRPVSDREAMKQLVDCVGMSARKKVLDSGRKPRILTSFPSRSSMNGTQRREFRFPSSPIPVPDYSVAGSSLSSSSASTSFSAVSLLQRPKSKLPPVITVEHISSSSGAEDTDSEGPPPSPSPTPRPGSALSMMSRRSGTPTINSTRTLSGSHTHTSTMLLGLQNASGKLGPSTNLSFSRELSEEASSLPVVDEVGEDGPAEEQVVARENDKFEEMENRLALMVSEICEMEERVAEVAGMLVC